jgi:uncharacterized protein (DUF2236 family)
MAPASPLNLDTIDQIDQIDTRALADMVAAMPPPAVARKVNREIVLLMGWTPAILMQFAHPLVAAGIAEHSSFRKNPRAWRKRLMSTVGSMLSLFFGGPEEVVGAASKINSIHNRVNGRLKEAAGAMPAGASYSARDPALLRWVHATLMEMLPRAYELYVGPLAPHERDQLIVDSSRGAPLLGIPHGYLPASAAEHRRYFDEMLTSGEIHVTDTARHLAAELLNPPSQGLAGPFFPLMRLPAIGLLPPSIRDAYGFRWERQHELALKSSAAVIKQTVRLSPPILRHWPMARLPA